MAQKQNLGSDLSISIIDNNTTYILEEPEQTKLTEISKEGDYTCTFCFKKFETAQAMGGHQNAHRKERLEEKRLYVKDPISYRKRAFLRATQGLGGESSLQGEGSGWTGQDPIGYRTHAYLSAMRANDAECPGAGGSSNQVTDLDAPSKMELPLIDKVGANEEISDPKGLDLRLTLGCYGGEDLDLNLML